MKQELLSRHTPGVEQRCYPDRQVSLRLGFVKLLDVVVDLDHRVQLAVLLISLLSLFQVSYLLRDEQGFDADAVPLTLWGELVYYLL